MPPLVAERSTAKPNHSLDDIDVIPPCSHTVTDLRYFLIAQLAEQSCNLTHPRMHVAKSIWGCIGGWDQKLRSSPDSRIIPQGRTREGQRQEILKISDLSQSRRSVYSVRAPSTAASEIVRLQLASPNKNSLGETRDSLLSAPNREIYSSLGLYEMRRIPP